MATVAVEVLAPPPFGPILVAHHKPSWQHGAELDRERQAGAAAGFIEALVAEGPQLPVILLSDFDAAPDTASMRFWTGRQSLQGVSVRYEDAWEAAHETSPVTRSLQRTRWSATGRCRWSAAVGSTTSSSAPAPTVRF